MAKEVGPCRGKPWGATHNSFSLLSLGRQHHDVTTYCLFPRNFSHFLVEILDLCVMNDLCHNFLNPNSVYIFSFAYFGLNWLLSFQFLTVCVYLFMCGPQTRLFLSNPGLSDVLCLNIAHLVSSSGHSASIRLLASVPRPDGP